MARLASLRPIVALWLYTLILLIDLKNIATHVRTCVPQVRKRHCPAAWLRCHLMLTLSSFSWSSRRRISLSQAQREIVKSSHITSSINKQQTAQFRLERVPRQKSHTYIDETSILLLCTSNHESRCSTWSNFARNRCIIMRIRGTCSGASEDWVVKINCIPWCFDRCYKNSSDYS